jgi:hypothetical protein
LIASDKQSGAGRRVIWASHRLKLALGYESVDWRSPRAICGGFKRDVGDMLFLSSAFLNHVR